MIKDIKLTTERLILRPLIDSDADNIAKAANNKNIYDNTLTIPYPYKKKDAREWIESLEKHYQSDYPDKVNLGIELEGKIIGVISLNSIEKNHKAEIGYWLSENYWGKGIMSEAVSTMIEFGFSKLKLKRIYAKTFTFNPASGKVLEKNGFEKEGLLKKEVVKDGRYLDAFLFGLIK
jgi:RimJ/RimL family protein N-acetyltransferase